MGNLAAWASSRGGWTTARSSLRAGRRTWQLVAELKNWWHPPEVNRLSSSKPSPAACTELEGHEGDDSDADEGFEEEEEELLADPLVAGTKNACGGLPLTKGTCSHPASQIPL